MKTMWPFKKKPKNNQIMFHGFDLNLWDYLGSTEITFDGVPNLIHFFWKKGDDERAYILTGRPEAILKTIAKLHAYVHNHCELWRVHELDIFLPIKNPSKFLKEWAFTNNGYVRNTETKWWVLASDQDRYKHSVAHHHKKHPEIYTTDNIVTVNFKKE